MSWYAAWYDVMSLHIGNMHTHICEENTLMCWEHAPSIIFMVEVDSIGSARSDSGGGGGGGDSEVQRTMLELLNQLDGFEATNKIKVGTRRCHALQVITACTMVLRPSTRSRLGAGAAVHVTCGTDDHRVGIGGP